METTVGVGTSNNSNPKEAGMEACRQAFEKVSSPKMVIVFSSVKNNQEEMLSGEADFAYLKSFIKLCNPRPGE